MASGRTFALSQSGGPEARALTAHRRAMELARIANPVRDRTLDGRTATPNQRSLAFNPPPVSALSSVNISKQRKKRKVF